LRRRLRSAERFRDLAISSALPDLKTSFSRSSASLCFVTAADHLRVGFLADLWESVFRDTMAASGYLALYGQIGLGPVPFLLLKPRSGIPQLEEEAAMHIEAMIKTHPQLRGNPDAALIRCIEACHDCAGSCTLCADACLGEEMIAELRRCIRRIMPIAASAPGSAGPVSRPARRRSPPRCFFYFATTALP